MSEEQISNQIQSQEQSQVQEKKIKVFYFMHEDGLESKYKFPLILIANGRSYNAFLKSKLNATTMYYVFDGKLYIKLWNDNAGNILTYIGSVKDPDTFFDDCGETVIVDYISYDKENDVIDCGNKKIKLEGFNLVDVLEKLDSDLVEPVLAVICTKLIP